MLSLISIIFAAIFAMRRVRDTRDRLRRTRPEGVSEEAYPKVRKVRPASRVIDALRGRRIGLPVPVEVERRVDDWSREDLNSPPKPSMYVQPAAVW